MPVIDQQNRKDKPPLNEQREESTFSKEIGQSAVHIVSKVFIGSFNIFGEVGVGVLDRNDKFILGGVGFKID